MMKLIVFAVEQGLCVYVRTPGDHGILVDCGKAASGGISPAAWIEEHEASTLKPFADDSAVALVVTHPHAAHVADIESVLSLLNPAAVCCKTDFDWPALMETEGGGENAVEAYRTWLSGAHPADLPSDLAAKLQCFALSQKEADELPTCAVNNRSVVTVVSYKSSQDYAWKVVIAGDNRTEGWEALLANPEFREAIKETDFFVTSLHGEEAGYSPELFTAMGKPIANISCSRKGGETTDAKYRRNAQGVKFPDGKRGHLITPDDGNITVEMRDDGNYDVWLLNS